MKKAIIAAALAMLLLPLLTIAQGSRSAGNVDVQQRIEFIYHTVKRGETVFSIAKRYNADVNQIYRFNPGCKEVLWAGATLMVPTTGTGAMQPDPNDTLHIKEHLQEFISEMSEMTHATIETPADINDMNKKISAIDTKWNVYYQAKQANIADNDSLTELVTQYQQLNQEVKDTIAATKTHFQLIDNFSKADKFISRQLTAYKEMSQQALELSLTSATAAKLKALKAKEQLLFADIEKNYQAAKAAAAQNASLTKPMSKITNNYVELKSYSEKIQAAEYKPFFTRIKDYLFGIAAVTIILMFANMMLAKVQAIKQAREAAKKMEKFRQQNDDEYPTI